MSADDMNKLKAVDRMLWNDYKIRREMLIKRLTVTLQSFLWSKRIKGTEEEKNLQSLVSRMHSTLVPDPPDDLLTQVFLTNGSLVNTMSVKTVTRGLSSFDTAVKHVRIGPVPDRGGRPDEARAVRDMPTFTPRSNNNVSTINHKAAFQKGNKDKHWHKKRQKKT